MLSLMADQYVPDTPFAAKLQNCTSRACVHSGAHHLESPSCSHGQDTECKPLQPIEACDRSCDQIVDLTTTALKP